VHYVTSPSSTGVSSIIWSGTNSITFEGQAAFVRNSKIEFPANVGASAGAIEIKLAWKVLTGAEGGSNRFLIKWLPVDANFSWLLQLEAKAKNPK
jgi:hypothetical protein